MYLSKWIVYCILDISLYNVRCQGRWYHRGTQELSCIVSFRINGLNWLCVSPWLYNSVIEFGICGLTLLSVSGLVGFHTCLIANMKTTNEHVSMVHASVETGSGKLGHIFLFGSSRSDPDWIMWDVKLIETQYGIAMIDATATFILHEPYPLLWWSLFAANAWEPQPLFCVCMCIQQSIFTAWRPLIHCCCKTPKLLPLQFAREFYSATHMQQTYGLHKATSIFTNHVLVYASLLVATPTNPLRYLFCYHVYT